MPDETITNSEFRVVPTPLVTHPAPVAQRLIMLHFPPAWTPRTAQVRLALGNQVLERDLGIIPPGESSAQILVPEVSTPTRADLHLSMGEQSWSSSLTLAPARPWTIYLVPHSHTDIGFTHPPSEVASIHDENTDEAIALCDLTREWPEGCRFKWTCEVSWQVQNYLRSRPARQVDRLRGCLQRGQMEVAAVYAGIHTDICSLEELVRSLQFAAGLRRQWGVHVATAMITDIPGATWAYPQVLAKSGIRYLILADNNFAAPFLPFTDLPRPFYWQAPDKSRVLAWYTDDPYWSYIEGYKLGFGESYRHVLQALPGKLIELEESGYPYDAFQLQFAFDNCRIQFRPALIAKEWHEQWANPRLRIATAHEFLAAMEHAHAERLPIYEGDWTSWWSGTVVGFPHETALGRRAKEELASAEKLGAWASSVGACTFPGALVREAYDNLLAFDEHSGGGGVWRPKSEEEKLRAVYEGYAFPHNAARAAGAALEGALTALAGHVPNPADRQAILAVNPLSWARTDIIDAVLPPEAGQPQAIVDPGSGRLLPCQVLESGVVRFLAPDIPALGYQAFQVASGEVTGSTGLEVGPRHLENEFYRVDLDAQGHIESIMDKQQDLELVAAGDGYRFGELVWYRPTPAKELAPGGDFTQQTELYEGVPVPGDILAPPERDVSVRVGARGPVSASLISEREVDGPFLLRQEVTLHAGLRRVDIAYELSPQGDITVTETRLGYLAFPFHLADPHVRLELPGALLTPEEEQIKGACRDFVAVQHWAAIYNRDHTVLLSPLDTPIVEAGRTRPSHQQFIRHWQAEAATVWARALVAGRRSAVTDSPYSQDAPMVFRFSLSSHAGSLDPVAAMQHGWAAFNPLLSRPLPPRQAGSLPADRCSWCQVSPANVMLLSVACPGGGMRTAYMTSADVMSSAGPASDGDGLILRLWEASGQECWATLSLPLLDGPLAAWRTSLVEEDEAPLEVDGHTIRVPIARFGLETVRIRFGERGSAR